jgi:GntR family transcriptional regulator
LSGRLCDVLDLLNSVPLYAQIAARLKAQIQAGQYAPGSRIPSEHELSARFKVGRPTARQATSVLVEERVLERRRGSGTYVCESPPEVDLFSAGGTLASFEKSGVPLETRLLGRLRRRRVPLEAKQPFAGRSAFFVARQGSIAGVPVLLEEMYFDPEAFPDLDRVALGGRSLSELARERYLLRPLSTEQRFSLVALDAERAKSLLLDRGTPVLKVERTLDFAGAPRGVFAELFCRTDQVLFTQRFALDRPLGPRGGSMTAK